MAERLRALAPDGVDVFFDNVGGAILQIGVDHMRRLRELQELTGGFQVFIPLSFQRENNPLGHLKNPLSGGVDDLKTLAVLKSIDPNEANPSATPKFQKDGIYVDEFNDRVWIFSHPTKNAIVLDAKSGDVVGFVDLGGVPEQAVSDSKGTLYVVMQDPIGSVAVVDAKAMKTTAHYPFPNIGRCNGLALDVKNAILFAACGATGDPPVQPPQPPLRFPPQPSVQRLSRLCPSVLTSLTTSVVKRKS